MNYSKIVGMTGLFILVVFYIIFSMLSGSYLMMIVGVGMPFMCLVLGFIILCMELMLGKTTFTKLSNNFLNWLYK